ncbi:helix-turn-helix transcriptional regulator [Nocardia farcinica]|uniref:winged helix-turn-helix transcriptional regulator n=1 Tax=Nocardia farcinica TaxID=37329 RepID=UPI001894CADC|nr:helix-turn-helix domain-containing protein [Nocardia farcinica]MBF6258485.1 helix-turn-helix transcriptional regulator [Nocardia farcinica]MBF6421166.1 helix-turn-helix transcriptional regulator [Nocardia farcinica]MBF6432823.1 helix-turn-helix transcriptional regulator [Nocardia farcinica]MBF6444975.1 helix-turn-helix transcriptional regulator [Nocardia farcinica]MBF6503263.1 helix-turn-helix transcriptional regulator [Nocardia farcinica]
MRSANREPGAGRAPDPAHDSVLAAMDLLGQRWMVRVVWELEPGPLGFLQLRRRMGNCSSSMLSNRLQQLQAAGLIVKHGPKGAYELTATGVALSAALRPLWEWAAAWTPADGVDAGEPDQALPVHRSNRGNR